MFVYSGNLKMKKIRTILLVEQNLELVLSVLLQALVHPLDRLLVRHLTAHERTATRFLPPLCTFRIFFCDFIFFPSFPFFFFFVVEPNKNNSTSWIDASIESRERESTYKNH